MKRLLNATAVVVASSLLLAACGGGGDDETMDPVVEMPDPAVDQQAAITSAITDAGVKVAMAASDADAVGAAEAAIAAANRAIMAGTDVSADVINDSEMAVTALEDELADIEDAHRMAMSDAQKATAAAMAKLGKDMMKALGMNPLDNIEGTGGAVFTSGGDLSINASADAGARTDGSNPDAVMLKPAGDAGSLGSWNGMNYALTADGKVTDEARVYTNQGAPRTIDFKDGGHIIISSGDNEGKVLVDGANPNLVMASAFTHSGTQDHTVPDKSDAVYFRGTYDGAAGEYSCSGDDCSSTNNGSGNPSALGGTWHFEPDEGAMVSRPDAEYLYYGWWVSKDSDGNPTVASAFHMPVDAAASAGALRVVDDLDSLTGSATYVGHAAGKFAMSNTLDGTGSGGHFTADAELSAKFDGAEGNDDSMVTGTIDNFRLNDGSEDPDWNVTLRGGDGAASGGTIDGTDTVWSINGNKATESGDWSGTMYDEAIQGDEDDGNNIPTTVTGVFHSEYSDIGRMVGAFGANKE